MALPTHAHLVKKAQRWLRNEVNCTPTLADPNTAAPLTPETPDAIGWRGPLSILVEVKVSRADFLVDLKKPFRREPREGMGDWRFYFCPPHVIAVADLPQGWGLIWVEGRRIIKSHGIPPNTLWGSTAPFLGNKAAESALLTSALTAAQKRLRSVSE